MSSNLLLIEASLTFWNFSSRSLTSLSTIRLKPKNDDCKINGGNNDNSNNNDDINNNGNNNDNNKRAPLSLLFRLLNCNDQVGTGKTPEAEIRVSCRENENIIAIESGLV